MGFSISTRASLNLLTGKILLQTSPLATKIREPRAQGTDSYPTYLPNEPRKKLSASYRAAPGRPGRLQTQSAPGDPHPSVPDAPFWWRAPPSPPSQTHMALSAAPSPGAAWCAQQGVRPETEPLISAGPGRQSNQPPRSSHAHFTPTHGGSVHVPQYPAWGGDVHPEATSLPPRLLGVVVLDPEHPPRALLQAFPRLLRTIKK